MTQNMKLDDLDKAALATLAEFEISNDGTVATVASAEIEVVRPTDNQFKMTIRFPSDEEFIVILSREKTLEDFGIKTDKS